MSRSSRNTVAAERDSKRRSEELTGVFSNITWSNEEGTFLIARLRSGQTIKGNAKPGSFIEGVEYIFGGNWKSDPRYGDSFFFNSYHAKDPVTPEALRGYLGRHICGTGCGIGTVGVGKLIAAFGADKVLHVMKYEPHNVAALLGLDKQQAEQAASILLSVEKFENTRLQLNQLFEGRGFPQTTIEACIETFGVNAVDAIKRDPFTMLVRGFTGCGFLRVNALYESLNLPLNRLKRQVICMWHLMTEGNGSVWYQADWIGQELSRMVTSSVNFRKAVRLGLRAKWISSHRDAKGELWLAAREHASVEREVKGLLVKLVTEEAQAEAEVLRREQKAAMKSPFDLPEDQDSSP